MSRTGVVVDADRDGRKVRWKPVRFRCGPPNAAGGATVRPAWGPGLRYPRGMPLLDALVDLSLGWRAQRMRSEVGG